MHQIFLPSLLPQGHWLDQYLRGVSLCPQAPWCLAGLGAFHLLWKISEGLVEPEKYWIKMDSGYVARLGKAW